MKKSHKQILRMLGISLFFGLLAGVTFGYLNNEFLISFVIGLGVSLAVWLLNTLLYLILTPKIAFLSREKRLFIEIPAFFLASLLGLLISVSILGYIFKFTFFGEKILFINIGLLLVLYLMMTGLTYSFRFYRALKEKEIASERLKALAAEAELKALKSQINPHFLFNTLNSISALIISKPELARKMIARLSELFRIVLESYDHTLVPLKKELNFVHLYLEMEKMRFDRKLDYREQIDPVLFDVRFPTMVLQPLLENAVKHGISGSRHGGTIQLAIERAGSSLNCHILNTVGKAKSIPRTSSTSNGTGMENIRQRLDLLFGDSYRFQAGLSERGTFEVSLSIPLG
jgi:sensor histidine kinase YesM